MSINNKPKMTSADLVKMLKEDKGVTFKYTQENEAVYYLENINNYFRTACYRKNYQKHEKGKNKGKYINLDFAYLQELSTIDMHLRNLITHMCIDIEHSLKVYLIHQIEIDSSEDGYEIVNGFLNKNTKIIDKIERISASQFTREIIDKYFIFLNTKNPKTPKEQINGPIWVLMELLTFGDLIIFYDFFYKQKKNKTKPIDTAILKLVKSLRNSCAHNNCILVDLNKNSSNPPRELSREVSSIKSVNKSERKKKLSCRFVLEFVSTLYVYKNIISPKVKQHRIEELEYLFFKRIPEKKGFFKKNELIISTYKFLEKIIKEFFLI